MPRFVFVKVPVEPKPCFVDFDSPIYVEMLARYIRRAVAGDAAHNIYVSEMMPDLSGAWLPDAAGERYTSEIRLVMLDGRQGAKSAQSDCDLGNQESSNE
jgi:hypothetical protein